MPEKRTITVYIDYKSPYAYLAKDLVYELERDLAVRIDWLAYILDIPSFLGSARLDEQGRVVEESRNAHQWRRVKYSYMDCRRQAKKRGLVIRGPQKIWDSTLAACGLLYAKRQGDRVLRQYHDIAGAGPREVDRISRAAEETGIFGVPSFVVDGEQFWGSEHLPDIREMLAAGPLEKAS